MPKRYPPEVNQEVVHATRTSGRPRTHQRSNPRPLHPRPPLTSWGPVVLISRGVDRSRSRVPGEGDLDQMRDDAPPDSA